MSALFFVFRVQGVGNCYAFFFCCPIYLKANGSKHYLKYVSLLLIISVAAARTLSASNTLGNSLGKTRLEEVVAV